ncbi:hypothetical protein RGQ13_19580 [Thalassotalea psychrophila]|uniref:Uncharacterized protein n=1 Tax=Thalassotalea psychrophila TaxID=3065647 RepID=A0ABY9TUP5_9GAMM|nr:hypothetical protein RGQ13_19580 [Colwelliaceae bacterium SQ149]
MDDLVAGQFVEEQRMALMLSLASSLAINVYMVRRVSFRINTWINVPICLLVFLAAIAWLTVSGNAIKVARAKLIKALHYE